jgi:uncharacterized protein (DUF433 family)
MNYLESNPEIANGQLVIKGTRIRIAQFLQFLKQGATLEQIQAWYPWISMRTLTGAIDEAIEALTRIARA